MKKEGRESFKKKYNTLFIRKDDPPYCDNLDTFTTEARGCTLRKVEGKIAYYVDSRIEAKDSLEMLEDFTKTHQ